MGQAHKSNSPYDQTKLGQALSKEDEKHWVNINTAALAVLWA